MKTVEISSKTQVGVIIVTSGCCGGDTAKGVVDRTKLLIEKIAAELGISVLIKEIGSTQALQGGLPAGLVAQAMETYARLGARIVPAIMMNGQWVSFGNPDEATLTRALLDAAKHSLISKERFSMNTELKERILPNGATKYIFFGGKGGVGKTTTATATAIWFADHGYDTTIVSTDPTMSLSVVLGQEIGGKERTRIRQVPNLCGLNINPKDAKGHYKTRFEQVMGTVNKEIGEEHAQTPCADEMATFDQFVSFLDEPPSPVVIFDTAPTGKTLREIAMPFNWADFIQKQIKEGRELAKLMNLGEDTDEALEKDKARYERAMAVLRDPARTVFNLVLLPERLPIEETAAAMGGLAHLNIIVQSLLVNQVIPQEIVMGNSFLENRVKLQNHFLSEIKERFTGTLCTELPMLARDVSDLEVLRWIGALLYEN